MQGPNTTDLHVYGGLCYHIYWFSAVELWIQKMGFRSLTCSPSGGEANHQKPLWKINITIGLAVRIELLKSCRQATACSCCVGPQNLEATL